jgi:hypothetical protein
MLLETGQFQMKGQADLQSVIGPQRRNLQRSLGITSKCATSFVPRLAAACI